MTNLPRTAAIIATIVAICFALLQLGGRALFWQLPRFEATINTLLASRGIVVKGLEGRWNGLNPGLFAASIRFPAGELTGFELELDVIESLGRNRIVAHRASLAEGNVTFVKTATGWRLQGGPETSGFDVATFLMHSDQVWLHGRITARDGTHDVTMHIESMHINQDGRHQFHFSAQSDPRCADCALMVEGDITDGGPGVVRVNAERFTLGGEFDAILGLSRLLTPSAPGRERLEIALNGDWRRDADLDAQARLDIQVAVLRTPGVPALLTAALSAWQEDGDYRGNINTLALSAGDHVTDLAGAGFALGGVNGRDQIFAELWLPEFSIAEALAPVTAVFGAKHPIGRWLHELAPRARIEDLRIRADDQGLAFQCRGSESALTGYNGVPEVVNAAFTASGHERALRLNFDGRDFELAAPNFLPTRGPYQRGGGLLTLAFAPGYLGVRSPDLWVARGDTTARAGFAAAIPADDAESHIAADINIDHVDAALARNYLPLTLAPELRQWLTSAVQSGQFHDSRLLYHGHIKTRSNLPMRRLELTTRVSTGIVDYHADWPTASEVEGSIEVTGAQTRVHGAARAFDTDLPDIKVLVSHDNGRARVQLAGDTTVARLIDFAWKTPAHEAMPFLSETWTGAGRVEFGADLTVPFQDQDLRPGDMQLDFHFHNASIDFADLGLHFDAVDERLHFEFPAGLASEALHGTLFGAPMRVAINSDDEAVRFSFTGSANANDVYQLLDIDDLGIAAGRFNYDAVFTVFPASDRVMELYLESSLTGLAVTLPQPLGKLPDESLQLTLSLQFMDHHVAVSARYGVTEGWLHVDDDDTLTGAVGIGAPVPMINANSRRVVLSGGLDEIDGVAVAKFLDDLEHGDPAPLAWELRRLRVDKLTLDYANLIDVVLNGYSDAGEFNVAVQSRELQGTLAKSGDAPWQIQIAELSLPAADDDLDPLAVPLIDYLFAADVNIDHVDVEGEDYGSWRFGLRPAADGVALHDLVADVKGLHIEASGPAFWSRRDESRFAGGITAGNLHEVLPQWEFAPSIESELFEFTGNIQWPGSPLNFDLERLSGEAALKLRNGRFLDIEQGGGAVRIMSLANFSTVVKRMGLDFSDVFGKGVSFQQVRADLDMVDGRARFTAPAEIVGTGSSFLITGTVDLDSGALDNEMIVTLPLHRSLPWYAVFLALTNPAGAVGVVAAGQVFKDQIKRLSSGKYRVGGTIDNPEVEFVGIFDNDIKATPKDPAASIKDQQQGGGTAKAQAVQ